MNRTNLGPDVERDKARRSLRLSLVFHRKVHAILKKDVACHLSAVLGWNYSKASMPFLSIMSNNFLDAPVGFLLPCSHFWTVDGLILKIYASAA